MTKRYPTLGKRVAFLKNPFVKNDITLVQNPNIDMIPMLWYCIHSEPHGEYNTYGETDWKPFLDKIFAA